MLRGVLPTSPLRCIPHYTPAQLPARPSGSHASRATGRSLPWQDVVRMHACVCVCGGGEGSLSKERGHLLDVHSVRGASTRACGVMLCTVLPPAGSVDVWLPWRGAELAVCAEQPERRHAHGRPGRRHAHRVRPQREHPCMHAGMWPFPAQAVPADPYVCVYVQRQPHPATTDEPAGRTSCHTSHTPRCMPADLT